ncbi:hypothetical protein [Derxia gummosa]|uniref:Uncharacterized protein n=1 Tax=Derxia gummosa DSM 723 TaxID=1121388 RepID=A0A8B6X666_9BURK|nr:hypothetical protein [Derxia gummosa]
MKLDRTAIEALLPHRAPILLPTEVEADPATRSGRALIRLDANARIFGALAQPALAHELLLEAAAQTFGIVIGACPPEGGAAAGAEGRHLLLGFDEVEFGPAALDGGAPFELEVALEQTSGPVHVARFSAEQGGAQVARGQLQVFNG